MHLSRMHIVHANMVHTDSWKSLPRLESLQLSFELRKSGDIMQLVGSEFQIDGAMKLNEHSSTNLRLHLDIFAAFRLRVEGA